MARPKKAAPKRAKKPLPLSARELASIDIFRLALRRRLRSVAPTPAWLKLPMSQRVDALLNEFEEVQADTDSGFVALETLERLAVKVLAVWDATVRTSPKGTRP